jgi:6-phosphogluconolactonase (cycloisomerase 2 family)
MPTARLRPALALCVLLLGAFPRVGRAVPRPYTGDVDLHAANVFLQAPQSILVPSSASGAHLYVTGGPGVVVLRRDETTGTVRFVERDDVDPGSQTTGRGALSPDGLHLYVPTTVVSPLTGFELSLFSRDAATGSLTPAGGVTVAGGVKAVAVSPDGLHVYAVGQSLSVFSRNAGTGALTLVETQPVANATGVVVAPDGLHVYVVRTADNSISVFARNAGTGALTLRGASTDGVGGADGLQGVTNLVVSPDGAQVYAAGRGENAVAVFTRSLATGLLTLAQVQRDGVGGVTGLVEPSGIAISGDGADVYAAAGPDAGLGAPGAVVAFARDLLTGLLTPVGTLENGGGIEGLGGPGIGISPDGLFVYVTGGVSMAVLARDPLLGTTTFVQRRSGFGGFALQGARDLAPTADGQNVYVASDIDRAVSILGVSSVDGALVFKGAVYQGEQGGISGVTNVATSPDGLSVYAASADTGTIATFARDPGTGLLTYGSEVVDGVGGVTGITDPVAMAVSPDGGHLYVAGGGTASVTTFARDLLTGALTFVETQVNGMGGVSGLSMPKALAVAPDGTSVYVVGGTGEIAEFSRDPGTGVLTFLAAVVDGDPGAERLGGARDVVVTPDGTQVAVAAETDDAVVIFARDPGTGLLTPSVTLHDVAGAGTLSGPTAVAVHSDGATLLVVANAAVPRAPSGTAPALWAFDRAPDGSLGFVNVKALADVMRVARFGAGDDAYAIQIGFGLRLYRFTPGFVGCDAAPRTGCLGLGTDGRSKLVVKVRLAPKVALKWKWSNGELTSAADLADIADQGAAWCMYDESTATPSLLARALAPGDSVRWAPGSTTKFKFKDKGRNPEGLVTVLVSTSSTSGRAKLAVRGSGGNLVLPTPGLPLPLRVQLQGRTACWETTFSAAGARQNGLGQFIGNGG